MFSGNFLKTVLQIVHCSTLAIPVVDDGAKHTVDFFAIHRYKQDGFGRTVARR